MIGAELLLPLPTLALAVGMRNCEPQPSAQIEITSVERSMKIDNSKAIREITAMASGAYKPAGAWAHATGLTIGIFQFQTRYKIRSIVETPSGNGCYWVEGVNVELSFAPTVYVAREYSPGTCRYQAVFAHEMKHVEVDREILARYQPAVKARLQRAIDQLGVLGPRPRSTEAEAKRRIASTIDQAVGQVLATVQTERQRRQQAVDTPEEYRSVQALCGR